MVIEDELKGIKRKWPWPIVGNRSSLLKQYFESVHPVALCTKDGNKFPSDTTLIYCRDLMWLNQLSYVYQDTNNYPSKAPHFLFVIRLQHRVSACNKPFLYKILNSLRMTQQEPKRVVTFRFLIINVDYGY